MTVVRYATVTGEQEGEMRWTAQRLLKWLQRDFDGALVGPETLRILRTPRLEPFMDLVGASDEIRAFLAVHPRAYVVAAVDAVSYRPVTRRYAGIAFNSAWS